MVVTLRLAVRPAGGAATLRAQLTGKSAVLRYTRLRWGTH